MLLRQLYLGDHLLNAILLLVCLVVGSLSITTQVINKSTEIYLLLVVISSYLLAIWLVIRLFSLILLIQLIVDIILRIFSLVTTVLYLFNQSSSRFNKSMVILDVIQLIFISMTFVSCYTVFYLRYMGLDVIDESDSEQPQSSSSSKTSQTKLSIDDYYKSKQNTTPIDNNNWMNVNVPKTLDFNDQMTVIESKSVPNFRLSINEIESTHETKHCVIPKSNNSKSHETLIPNSTSDNSIVQPVEFEGVRRSKTTSQLNNPRFTKRQQKWNSINDERVFLKNINESLLPSVLKKGESPILALRRQQQTFESNRSSFESNKTLDEGPVPDPEYIREYNYHSKVAQPVVEFEPPPPSMTIEDDNSANLPYISEFDEEGNFPTSSHSFEDHFKDFDQTTRMEIEKDVEDFKIPRTIKKKWIEKAPSMNHISMADWNEKAQTYQNFRSRSGANLNIPGISRIVSDHNLLHDSQATLTQDDNYLLPSLDQRADDIDNLSDIISSTHSYEASANGQEKQSSHLVRPIFSHSNRSMSAPSLQTFRNVSNGSKSSTSELSQGSIRISTPPPFEEDDAKPVKQSPIKRLYQSPSKLFRRSIDQMDTYQQNHKHSNSMISMQYSLYSSTSKLSNNSPKRPGFIGHNKSLSMGSNRSRSRSTSPKRSFKSLLSKKSSNNHLNQKLTVAPPTLLKQAQVKKQDLKQEPDFWEIHSAQSLVNSRVSSIPSAVIGEYDKEKWNTLKVLNDS